MLNKDEASVVVPLFQMIPIFSYVLSFVFLGEQLLIRQILASLLIIIGAIGISVELDKGSLKIKKSVLLLMAISSLMTALNGLIFKFVAIQESFWTTSFWEYIGFIILGLSIIFFVKKFRSQFFLGFKEKFL